MNPFISLSFFTDGAKWTPSIQELWSEPVQRCVDDYLNTLFGYFKECSVRQGGLCVDLNDIRFEQIPTSSLNKHIYAVLEEKSGELSLLFREGFFNSFIDILNDTVKNFNSNKYYQKLRVYAPEEWAREVSIAVYEAGVSIFRMVSLKGSNALYSPEGIVRTECARQIFSNKPETSVPKALGELSNLDSKLVFGVLVTATAAATVWGFAKYLLNREEKEEVKPVKKKKPRNRYRPELEDFYKEPPKTNKIQAKQQKSVSSLPRVSSAELKEQEAERKKQEALKEEQERQAALEREWEKRGKSILKLTK